MALAIRDAALADAPQIAALYAGEVRHGINTYELEVPDAAEMAMRMQHLLAAGYPYLVAESDGAFAGYAYASSFRARAGYRHTVENSVYVSPAHQGEGIGTALMERLVEECTNRGYRQMVSVIGDPGNMASIRLHERFGFRHIGTFPGIAFKHGRWLDTVFMQRALGHEGAAGALPSDRINPTNGD
ncbi:N-acetyltransferase family protein [Luteimonas aestuarii]|uniref:N-acetyltransferase family protein n=1 Tax=Luteimonas aestuarii TaxID=453837 RepID=A0A4R5TN01_9GAMM|nr:GNAT family N-acetyltransferase [Luteimonas aestuarii]TDK23323.1 N-acetyltransferase family protein [Luteimonas aestuarii]